MGYFLMLLSTLSLGITLGANDAGNVFGAAVATRFIKYRTAVILIFIFVLIGSILQGGKGIDTLRAVTNQNVNTSVLVGLVVAGVGIIFTFLGQPISLSQSVVGGLLGLGLSQKTLDIGIIEKIVLSWITAPLGACMCALILYKFFNAIFSNLSIGILQRELIIKVGLIIAGVIGAYALGANNVANTVGMFAGVWSETSTIELTFLGGASIGIGALLFSRSVMMNIGEGIVALDGFSAFVSVVSSGVTVYIFSIIGVPVSTTHTIVGAVVGVGIHHGFHTLKFKTIREILLSWVFAPAICLILTSSGYAIFIA
ncbi:MAG: anion permease [Candidatus Hydrogenedentes bacterium]|nr:anion permease [Candidatus Hydrogenedentota bacterium]